MCVKCAFYLPKHHWCILQPNCKWEFVLSSLVLRAQPIQHSLTPPTPSFLLPFSVHSSVQPSSSSLLRIISTRQVETKLERRKEVWRRNVAAELFRIERIFFFLVCIKRLTRCKESVCPGWDVTVTALVKSLSSIF